MLTLQYNLNLPLVRLGKSSNYRHFDKLKISTNSKYCQTQIINKLKLSTTQNIKTSNYRQTQTIKILRKPYMVFLFHCRHDKMKYLKFCEFNFCQYLSRYLFLAIFFVSVKHF